MTIQKGMMAPLGRGKNSLSDKTRSPWPFLTDRLPFGSVHVWCISQHIA
jgi:hypothetical protein